MACLKEQSVEIATGDPITCQNCTGVLNMYSEIKVEGDEGAQKQVWNCEFCNHRNVVNIEPEEKPKTEAVSYITEAAPVKSEAEKQAKT